MPARSNVCKAILIVALMLPLASPVTAEEDLKTAASAADMKELADHADLIVLGQVERVLTAMRATQVKFHVNEVFQGEVNGSFIWVESKSGKVFRDDTEPQFMSPEKAILFLYESDGIYRCVNGDFGKKTIRHENIYTDPKNSFKNVKLKDYLEQLRSLHMITNEAKPMVNAHG